VGAKKVGCGFCGTFCALVDAVLPLCACEACSTRKSCKHVHDEPYSQPEVEIERWGSAGGGTKSEAPALGHGRIVACHSSVAQITKRGATVRLHELAFFFVSCKPAGLIRVTGPPS